MADWETELRDIVQPVVARSHHLKSLTVDRGVLARAGTIIREHFEGDTIIVFADEAGFGAAGDAFTASAQAAGYTVKTHIIPAQPRPKASAELSETFAPLIAEPGIIPVALGSGVMNDLVKHAAFLEDRPYCVVATAASMDGYASAGAPLSKGGFKITIPARCPRAIIADLDVIGAAPKEMAGWGYGDLAGKVPSGADWIIADALGIEPIDAEIWSLVQDHLRAALGQPAAVREGESEAIAKLFSGLTLSGLAMEFHGGSRPASGAEHQIAHMWEMQSLSFAGERVSHGACVAIGTNTVLGLYDWLLAQDLTRLDIDRIVAEAPTLEHKYAEIDRRITETRIAERAHVETKAKHADTAELRARLETLTRVWPDLRTRLSDQLLPAAEMAGMLGQAGSPVTPGEIGVSTDTLKQTVYSARFLRSRYTVFDLLDETGLLDTAIAAVLDDASAARSN